MRKADYSLADELFPYPSQHGGKRINSGRKKISDAKTVVIRIDERLLEAVNQLSAHFKETGEIAKPSEFKAALEYEKQRSIAYCSDAIRLRSELIDAVNLLKQHGIKFNAKF